MPASRHQESTLAEEAVDSDISRNRMGRTSKGSCAVAIEQEMRTHFEPHGDVMFVDICDALPTDRIDVIEVGEQVGFPGLIQVRVNREKQLLYGLTIQNFTAFRRKLFWSYRMASVKSALVLLIMGLKAGFRADHNSSTAGAW